MTRHRENVFFAAFGLLLLSLLLVVGVARTHSAPAADDATDASLLFVENVGQFDADARFQLWGADERIWVGADSLWVTRVAADATAVSHIQVAFEGANPQPTIEAFAPAEATFSYFIGQDAAGWRADVPVWHGVRYVDLYPGIDLVLTGRDGQVTPQFVARTAVADLTAVQVRVNGAEGVSLLGDRLMATTIHGPVSLPSFEVVGVDGVREKAAVVDDDGAPAAVLADATAVDTVASNDPIFSTYLGANSEDQGRGMAVSATGDVYVTGYTRSASFPTTPGAFDTTHNGDRDAFVVKLAPDGKSLVYATFIGGSQDDLAKGIAIDDTGSAFVAGDTESANFPTVSGDYDETHNGMSDAFVLRLATTGSVLMFSTFVGGSDNDFSGAIALDTNKDAYVAGSSFSADFPTTPGSFGTSLKGPNDVMVIKVSKNGNDLMYAGLLGGSGADYGRAALAVDVAGAAHVTGQTESADFPTTGSAYDTTYNGGSRDVFVSKIKPNGSGLDYSTFLGGSAEDGGSDMGIAVDVGGNTYISGRTASGDFPTTPGAYDSSLSGANDAFVAKFNPGGSILIYSTFIGGSSGEQAFDLALNDEAGAYVVGQTNSANFPTTPGAFDRTANGLNDGFVALISPDGDALQYGTYLGGSADDLVRATAVDSAGNILVSGITFSSNFPTTAGAYDTSYNGGGQDAYVTKLPPGGEPQPVYLPAMFANYSSYFEGPFEVEPNDTSAQANGPLESGKEYQGYPNDQRDFFSVQLLSPGSISVDVQNHTGNGVQVQLYEAPITGSSTPVAFDVSPPYQFTYNGATTGQYFIFIFTESGFNSTNAYKVRVTYP